MKYISGVFFIASILICDLFLSTVSAQNTSNKGTDFWLAYGNHVAGYSNTIGQEMVIYVTSDVNTSGVMEVGGVSIPFQVTANAITNVPVPQTAYIGNLQGKISNKGIHITSFLPIVVYAHIYDSAISGATLVLPTNTLGKDYYSLNYEQISNSPNSHSFFFVVATEDNTEIIITPSVDTQGDLKAGQTSVPIKLNKGEIYQVFGKETSSITRVIGKNTQYTTHGTDLTGTRIQSVSTTSESCKKIAVFSGSGKMAIGCLDAAGFAGSADNLFQQVYPTASWGKTFITVPSKDRNYDVYRIFKSDPNAIVKLNGVEIPDVSFINNFYYEFSSQEVNFIESDKPIQAALYTVSQGKSINCTNVPGDVGDPEMIFLNPLEQTLSQITMYSTELYKILKHFINVVIPGTAVSSFKIDGISQAALFKSVPGKPAYSYAQIPVNAGTHNLEASEGFNAIAYGFGNAESYGYAAGANVKGLGVEIRKVANKKLVSTVCVNEELNLSVKLNSTTNRILWDLGDGSAPLEILNPVPINASPVDGLFEYLYPNKVVYSELKDYKIIVTANKISTDGCGSTEVSELQFSSVNLPSAAISPQSQACVNAPVAFKDISSANGRNIVKWLWDFDDGEISIEQNPIHIFKKSGTYTVKLIVEGDTGCASDVITQVITVYALPVANFTVGQPACEALNLIFTDQSTSTQGKIIKWIWDFGDESPLEEKDSNAPITHIFSVAKTYQVKLKVISEYGCESLVFEKSVIINPLPIVDFVLPEVCIEDPFAQFTNVSTISDASVLSYFWDFGDPTSNTNTSQQENPRHRYTIVGDYMVSLTVTSKFGCVIKTDKKFTLNGGKPVAKFSVLNDTQLCSNNAVVFKNESTVDPGTIGKVVWYFGNTNDPTTKLEYDDPFPGKEYSIKYDTFYTPAFKKITVRMLAYSGGICVDEEIQDIILMAAPLLSFNPIPDVCQEAAPFKIIQASESSGQSGVFTFSGPGVSPLGVFNPSVAGVGTHTIQYLFTSNNGCSESISKSITVMPTPLVNAGRDTVMLEGGEIKMYGKASGGNLSYKWFPSDGLSQDDIIDPIASPTDNTTYTLSVTSDQGCVSMDKIFIKVLKQPIVPTAFSPNNDSVNDLWNIKYLESYSNATVQVFNRNGEIVYRSMKGYSSPWNGQFNGIDLPVGTYYYIIDPRTKGRKAVSGAVTILR